MTDVQTLIEREIGLNNWTYYDNALHRLVVSRHDAYHGIEPCEFIADSNPEPPIFACRFAETKNYKHFVAIANEDGGVAIQDTLLVKESIEEHAPLTGVQCHQNAVFDLAWMFEEMNFVTVSGDHSARLWNICEAEVKQTRSFYGHTKSVKTATFRPQDRSVFATGARDGKVLVWDLRSNNLDKPDNSIVNCHPINSAKTPVSASKRSSRVAGHPRANSITGLIFQDENTLISCADGDGNIKIWDLRKNYTVHTKDPLPKQSIPYCGSSSKNGYTNLIFDKSHFVLFANCMDNVIYSFNVADYSAVPLQRYVGHENGSFYIKSSLSPEGNYLLSGSSNEKAYIWNVKYSEPIVQLEGHSAEVTCATWCQVGHTKIITCSDDARHKIWRVGKEWPDEDDVRDYRGSAKRFPHSGKLRRTLDQTPHSMKRKSTELLETSSKKKCPRLNTNMTSPRTRTLSTRRSSKRSLIDMLNGTTLPTLKEENLENEPNHLNMHDEVKDYSSDEASTSKKHFSNDLIEGLIKLDTTSLLNDDDHTETAGPSHSLNKYNPLRTPTKSPRKLVISPKKKSRTSPCFSGFEYPNFVLNGDAPHLGLMSPPKKVCRSIDWLTRLSIEKNVNKPNSPKSPQGLAVPTRRNSISKSNTDPNKTPVRCKVKSTLLNYFPKSTEKK